MTGQQIEKIRGVNLGNWLVLEKWMNPAMFEGTTAADEYYLPQHLSPEVYAERIRRHRAEYITERDFVTIRSMGLNAVRIPVPYFIFGDRKPFIGCIEELDNAFDWAERWGLKILIDLHTAPLSQNGFDNGGICGVCRFFQEPGEIEFVMTVLERLAKRYKDRQALWGIELLNEPIPQEMWIRTRVPERYIPVDPELAKGSRGYQEEEVKNFYLAAYDRIRPILPADKYIVIHDGFDLSIWDDFMREEKYYGVVLDTHQYLMSAEEMGCSHSLKGYLKFIEEKYGGDMERLQQYFPIVCGEWCLSNSLSREAATQEEADAIYRALDRAQRAAWDRGSGYFYWSYKLLIDTVHDCPGSGRESWDLGRCVDEGWFARETAAE